MKSMKDKFPISDFPEAIQPDIEEILIHFQRMEALAGGTDLDAATELLEGFGEFGKHMKAVISRLPKVIKTTGDDSLIRSLKDHWEGEEFWKSVEKNVEQATKSWFELSFLREEEETEQEDFLKKSFSYNYKDKESPYFAAGQMKRTETELRAVYRLFVFCDEILVLKQVSQRRFKALLTEFAGFTPTVIDFLWEIYQAELPVVEKHAFSIYMGMLMKRTVSLESTMERIVTGMDGLTDSIRELFESFSDILDLLTEEDSLE